VYGKTDSEDKPTEAKKDVKERIFKGKKKGGADEC
jgi:hypothetical protein